MTAEEAKNDKSKFTARNAAKWLARGVVQYQATAFTANLAADYTRFEKDDMIVKLGAGLVGWGVGDAVEPLTDKLVDKSFDFAAKQIENLKTKREAKKANEKSPEKK